GDFLPCPEWPASGNSIYRCSDQCIPLQGDRPMAQTVVPDLGIVLAFIREGQGWNQTRLARAAGTTPKVINDYEHGRRRLTRARLESLLAHMAVPPERIDSTLSCLAANRASARAPSEPGDAFAVPQRRIEKVSLGFGRLTEEFVRGGLQFLTVEGAGHCRSAER